MRFLFLGLIAVTCFTSLADADRFFGSTSITNSGTVEFEMTLSYDGEEYRLTCSSENCAWKSVSYWSSPQRTFYLDGTGVTDEKPDRDQKLLIAVHPVADGVVKMEGIRGTAWTEVTFTIPVGGTQKFNQLGMR